jgi:hypothetical protein
VTRATTAAALAVAATAAAAAPAQATLAYTKGLLSGKPVVWAADDDGSGAHKLATGGSGPKVSPDGTQVAYVAGTRSNTLFVKPAAGGPAVAVAKKVWYVDAVQWSPDNEKLSVITGPELGPYRLKVCDLVATGCRTAAKGYFHGVSFAPGGEGLAFSRGFTDSFPAKANLYAADNDGTGVVKLTDDGNATNPVWGPEKIAYDRARKPARKGDYPKLDIYTINPDGSGRTRVTTTNPPFLLAGLRPIAWSQDGRRLVAEYGGQDTSEAWRVAVTTGKAADATGGFDGVVGWGISRDGAAILGTTGYFDDPKGNVVAVAWNGGAQTVLARGATQPSWNR